MPRDREPRRIAADSRPGATHLADAARVLLEAGRFTEAEAAFQDLCQRHPDLPAGLVGLATVAMRSGQWQTAIDRWDACLARHPAKQQPFWHLMRCRALVEIGRDAEAEAACLAEVERSPGDVRPVRHLYGLVASRWPAARLLRLLDRLELLAPDDPWGPFTRAWLLATMGHPQSCRDRLEAMLAGTCGPVARSLEQYRSMFRAIQVSCCDHRRIVLLERLSDLVRDHAEHEPSADAEILHAQLRMALEDYDASSRILAGMRARGLEHAHVAGMWDVCQRRAAPAFPAYDAPKVFCIGLSKTATTSLDGALGLLGLRSIHWTNPYTATAISDTDLLLFDAFSDIGISWRFEALYTTFPNARFIYTTREIGEWVRSVTAHYARMFGVTAPHELQRPGILQRHDGMAGRAEANLYARHASWEDAWVEFDRRVRHFFADKPPGKVLELAICEGDGWEKLCGFLGVPVPDSPFPVRNVAPRAV